jgi:hypothetical protein
VVGRGTVSPGLRATAAVSAGLGVALTAAVAPYTRLGGALALGIAGWIALVVLLLARAKSERLVRRVLPLILLVLFGAYLLGLGPEQLDSATLLSSAGEALCGFATFECATAALFESVPLDRPLRVALPRLSFLGAVGLAGALLGVAVVEVGSLLRSSGLAGLVGGAVATCLILALLLSRLKEPPRSS